MSFVNIIHTLGTNLGLIPNGTPSAEQLDRLYRTQMYNLRAGYIAVGFGGVTIAAEVYNAGFNIDRIIQAMLLLAVFGFLQAFRAQIAATDVWRAVATSLQTSFVSMHETSVRLSALYERDRRLQEAIFQIPDGWMSSYGVMNVSRHQKGNRIGPTCFLWRPDMTLKNGKIESRAVSGEGDSIADAILDAIRQIKEF